MENVSPETRRRDLFHVLAAWFALAVIWICVGSQNISVPGLYYDEAHCPGMAKDFLTGHANPHQRGYGVVNLFGRPFPMFVQPYGGAVKSWLLIPSFAIFGTSMAVLRMTALSLGLVALLLCMLWIHQWLGKSAAILTGVLLALDPSYFFICLLDWGPVLPSFLCRFAMFLLTLQWWRNRQTKKGLVFALFAGFFGGLGFFNKVDYAVLVAGVPLAYFCCHPHRHLLKDFFGPALILALAGAVIGASPMLSHVPQILGDNFHGTHAVRLPGEMLNRTRSMIAMFDGTYFYHLMESGGMFERMWSGHAPFYVPIGIVFALAGIYAAIKSRAGTFVVLAAVFIMGGLFLLPAQVRIHHTVAVYPFPQLAMALAITQLWQRKWIIAIFAFFVASEAFGIYKTEQFIHETGGCGRWSDALNTFAASVKNRSDLTLVSLDWGFNEQLAFLTDGPKLIEPFWSKWPPDPGPTNFVYLVHPPEYTLYPFGESRLNRAWRAGTNVYDIQEWPDHNGRIAFYTFRRKIPVREIETGQSPAK
jgi:hypothetical protein